MEGIRAGGDVRVLMQGNPTVTGGHYQDAFGRNRAIWKTFTISAFDTPNLQGLTIEQLLAMSDDELSVAPAPYLVTRRWVKERYQRWGPNHPDVSGARTGRVSRTIGDVGLLVDVDRAGLAGTGFSRAEQRSHPGRY